MKTLFYMISMCILLSCVQDIQEEDGADEIFVRQTFNIGHSLNTKSRLTQDSESKISNVDIILFSKKDGQNLFRFEGIRKWEDNLQFDYLLSNKRSYYFYILVNFDIDLDNIPKEMRQIEDLKLAFPTYEQMKERGMPFYAKKLGFRVGDKDRTFALIRLLSKYTIVIDKSSMQNYEIDIHKIQAYNTALFCQPFSNAGFKARTEEEVCSSHLLNNDRTDYEYDIHMDKDNQKESFSIYLAENRQGDLLIPAAYTQSNIEEAFRLQGKSEYLGLVSYFVVDYTLSNLSNDKTEHKTLKYYCGLNKAYNFDVKRNNKIGITIIPDNMNIRKEDPLVSNLIGLEDMPYIAERRSLNLTIQNAYNDEFSWELSNADVSELSLLQERRKDDNLYLRLSLANLKTGKNNIIIKQGQKIVKTIPFEVLAPRILFDKNIYTLDYSRENIVNLHYCNDQGENIEDRLDPELFQQVLGLRLTVQEEDLAALLDIQKIGNSFIIEPSKLAHALRIRYENRYVLGVHKDVLRAETLLADRGIEARNADIEIDEIDKIMAVNVNAELQLHFREYSVDKTLFDNLRLRIIMVRSQPEVKRYLIDNSYQYSYDLKNNFNLFEYAFSYSLDKNSPFLLNYAKNHNSQTISEIHKLRLSLNSDEYRLDKMLFQYRPEIFVFDLNIDNQTPDYVLYPISAEEAKLNLLLRK